MSNITDWIKYELYPSLFESIDIAFPEHNFKRYSGGWRSNTYLDSSKHNREDKTVVTKQAPNLILEQGGEAISLVDYVMRRDTVDFLPAVKTLAEVVGLQIPNNSEFDREEYKSSRERATLLEVANSYFVFCLEKSTGAEDIRKYLKQRGYSLDDIKEMEIGYIPSQSDVFKYLLSKEYSHNRISEVLKVNEAIGTTHKLTIPYRSGGAIKGFKFRTITDITPKYLNSTGLDKNGGFFNLLGIKGDKDIVIVEGELDSLHATVKGVDNVVATGGSSISSEQIKDAIKRGAKKFSICFDREPGKEEETEKKINKAVDIILTEGVNRVYIVTLPDLGGPKTDVDRLIKEKGVDSFKEAILKADSYFEYRLQNIISKYGKIQDERGLQSKDIDNLLDEVVETAINITDTTDRDRFKKAFTSLGAITELGITEESLSITLDRLTSTKDKEDQAKDFKKLLTEATQLQDKGELDKALELLDKKVKEVKLKDKTTEFSSLLLPIKEDELKQRQATKPDSLSSGYTIGGEELLLPSGAISIFAAPTSHGKTTFLLNLALNVTQTYKDKEIYFFSYEEDGDSVLLKALNIYADTVLHGNNRRAIKDYFTKGTTDYIRAETVANFKRSKELFFKQLIDNRRLNIHYSSYDSDTLIEAIRYLYKHTNVGAIFIDYIQLLNLPEGKYKTYSRQEEIKEICIALKDIAIETGLPIILGAQFNREVVNQNKLHATKIGEAGDIERIANLIVGFWNNSLKAIAEPKEVSELDNKGNNTPTIYATILKNRDGKVGGEELLDFAGNTGKIKNSKPNNIDYFK